MNNNLDLIIERFGSNYVKASSHNELIYKCPFCLSKRGKEDNDGKLYVNRDSLKFFCFKCGSKGRIKRIKSLESPYGVYEKLISFDKYNTSDIDEDDSDNMFYIPNTKILKDTVAYNYCLKRGITEELINYYEIKLGISDLMGRIVIPNQMIGDCWTDMYSARSVINQIPKYKNPSGAKKTELVFNLHRIEDNPDKIIIVEGAITAICAGKDAVATYGCHPSNEQINQIINKNPKSIYCCLDNDSAGNSGTKFLLGYLSTNYKGNVYNIEMPEGIDACDMGFVEFRKYIESNKNLYENDVYYRLRKAVEDV